MNHAHGPELFGSTYVRGEVIFRQGDPGDVMYIIQSGAVEVSQGRNGGDTVIAILEKGDFFGEMALLQNDVRSATVTAISRTRLIPLTKAMLVDRLKQDPVVALHLLKKLIARIHHAHRRYRKALQEDEGFRKAVAVGQPQPADDDQTTPPHRTVAELANDLLLAGLEDDLSRYRCHARPGETLFREGDTGDCMYLIVSGRVGVGKQATHDTRLIDTIGPGDFFGEMALIAEIPRSATVTAMEPTELIVIDKQRFLESLETRPELAVAIVKTLIFRLGCLEDLLANRRGRRRQRRAAWMPKIVKRDRIGLSIVSLSTCAGCSAVLMDHALLTDLLAKASIDYCQMLMDRETLPESEVILVDGVVRLKEDQERLEEARRKCRHLVAWGTCAAFAGIPALANRFELETVIAESYRAADDAFSYYLSGVSGNACSRIEPVTGIELQRRVFAIDSFARVDYYLPGCPPEPHLLRELIEDLTGGRPASTPPIVCARCGRKPIKGAPVAETKPPTGGICFNSAGRICLGFMTRGGCTAICPRKGTPCWGCRGPSKKAVAGLKDGETLETIALRGIAQRRGGSDDRLVKTVQGIKQSGHFMFTMDSDTTDKLMRVR